MYKVYKVKDNIINNNNNCQQFNEPKVQYMTSSQGTDSLACL